MHELQIASFDNSLFVKSGSAGLQKMPSVTLSKNEMLRAFNGLLSRFYGGCTKVQPRVERLPKQRLLEVYEAVWLWRNDPLAEQVKTLEEWLSASF
jgi:hypothetical protein